MTIPRHHANPSGLRPLSASVGIGLKTDYFQALLETHSSIGFLEIHAENYMVEGGYRHHMLSRLREQYPLSIHGVGLSIGSEQPINDAHLKRLEGLLQRYQPDLFSEHLAWSSHQDYFLNDLLPIAYTEQTLQRVCDHIDYIQNRLKRTLLLENPATYLQFQQSNLSEVEFMSAIVQRTGCGLLLDVNNVHVSCHNHGLEAQAYLMALPLDAVQEIHLAGFSIDSATGLLIDSHDQSISDPVWQLYALALAHIGPCPTLIERDGNLPPFETLLQEVQQAKQVQNRQLITETTGLTR